MYWLWKSTRPVVFPVGRLRWLAIRPRFGWYWLGLHSGAGRSHQDEQPQSIQYFGTVHRNKQINQLLTNYII